MNNKILRIGTRDSTLAMWQARFVADHLETEGWRAKLHGIKTEGDRVLDTPLPLMGGKGVFTRALDDSLLRGEVDMAVHSLKDIPTRLPDELEIAAITKRERAEDVLVTRKGTGFLSDTQARAIIATSSNRRMGQWLSRYPHHRMADIRGNISTRLQKLSESGWDAAIFAAAGLIRLGLQHRIDQILDWMLPAPGQGAVAVMIRREDRRVADALRSVNHEESAICTRVERQLLYHLEGGCSAPVGARAYISEGIIYLHVSIVRPDGSGEIRFEKSGPVEEAGRLGWHAAREAISRGAGRLLGHEDSFRGAVRKPGHEDSFRGAVRKPGHEDSSRGAGMQPDHEDGSRGAGRQPGHEVGSEKAAETPLKQKSAAAQSARVVPGIVVVTRDPEENEVGVSPPGLEIVYRPVFDYRYEYAGFRQIRDILTSGKYQAWVFTSRRGVLGWWHCWEKHRREIEHSTRKIRVYALGERTGKVFLETFGTCRVFQSLHSEQGEVKLRQPDTPEGNHLAMLLAADKISSAVHFCGRERREELRRMSKSHGISLKELVVYFRIPVENPEPLPRNISAVLFFSPDGVENFFKMYGIPPGNWKAVAIGPTTSKSVYRLTGRVPGTASAPGLKEMLDLVLISDDNKGREGYGS